MDKMHKDISLQRFLVTDVRPYPNELIDWGLRSLGVPELWRQTQGEGVRVAVLDSGIDNRHPDLIGSIENEIDFTDSPVGTFDRTGHGTHVAGIIAARINQSGIIGLAPKSKILNVKVLDDHGFGSSANVAKGVYWAIENGAHVINMSFGAPLPNEELAEAIRVAASKNIILVAAAGNYGSYYFNTVNYPAKFEHVISVGSVNKYFIRSRYSATGGDLDIMAPGESIYSCFPLGMYVKLSGTSMAAPYVSGVVALCLAKHQSLGGRTPCRNYLEMKEHLKNTAIDIGEFGPDHLHGFGLINPTAIK